MKKQHKSQKTRPETCDIGKLILRFMNKKASKSIIIKQIADGIEYKKSETKRTRFTSFTNCVQKIK